MAIDMRLVHMIVSMMVHRVEGPLQVAPMDVTTHHSIAPTVVEEAVETV